PRRATCSTSRWIPAPPPGTSPPRAPGSATTATPTAPPSWTCRTNAGDRCRAAVGRWAPDEQARARRRRRLLAGVEERRAEDPARAPHPAQGRVAAEGQGRPG